MAHDLAREHNGLMAIVEHRFYGGSLPFGPVDSFAARPDRIGLLTIEQAMADYAAVIQSIQKEHGMVGAPVVSLGGSYSGKLSAYSKCRDRWGVWFVCVDLDTKRLSFLIGVSVRLSPRAQCAARPILTTPTELA